MLVTDQHDRVSRLKSMAEISGRRLFYLFATVVFQLSHRLHDSVRSTCARRTCSTHISSARCVITFAGIRHKAERLRSSCIGSSFLGCTLLRDTDFGPRTRSWQKCFYYLVYAYVTYMYVLRVCIYNFFCSIGRRHPVYWYTIH